ncbi:DUF4920 domain-containing protein [Marinirhabdus gelatinilytica]|uniref:Uncharacterized protein DUF4920 n=1 Tax=Marinirhabdus gelatinilytica TaxID=1703343 RepID=A0A370Q8R8_9FLAO|nr:DUF4920 domain-containing protein [Marinirhabdus gelatinilytica]RDK84756.1 uncharacterized protein DUF4920 [Marinirhabdus gelatinilytica]
MKNIIFAVLSLAVLTACNNKVEKETEVEKEVETITTETLAYQEFGEKITDADVLTKEEMYEKYKNLKPGDTAQVKFKAKVNSVCQNKGCWMRLDVGDEEALIKFKNYGFFMPKDIAGDEVIVRGKAYVDEMSVEDQRHFAEDAGKSNEEIAAITTPKKTLSFTADGVLLPENQ